MIAVKITMKEIVIPELSITHIGGNIDIRIATKALRRNLSKFFLLKNIVIFCEM